MIKTRPPRDNQMMGKTKPFGEVGDKMTDNAVLGFWQKAEITDQDLRITAEKPKNSHFAVFSSSPKLDLSHA